MTEPINTAPRWLALRDRGEFANATAIDIVTDDSDVPITDEADSYVTNE